jgi:hypothetical protein
MAPRTLNLTGPNTAIDAPAVRHAHNVEAMERRDKTSKGGIIQSERKTIKLSA